MNHFSVLIRLLRDRPAVLDEIRQDIKLERKIVSLLISSTVFLAVYGAIIGASSSWLQMLSSAVKLPALYLITLIICLPTLYFFDILFGSTLNFRQYTAMVLTAVSVISVLLFSFAPVSLFFLISVQGYSFFLLLNVAIMGLTGVVGIKLFYDGMRDVAAHQADEDKLRNRLLKGWLVLYALVGSQLGWTLRPFFGAPSEQFQLFRPEIDGNFYGQVFRMIFQIFGIDF
ncbi:MAG: actin-binding WH2 domain-containing protein [Leptolyngbyaceae cyanobacterium SM1_1_3]|nr:actin-binding WH2 domain-containing protein [Leptolyngbyaceae cyanobacterium SM1_1_3]NJM85611.1 actin-binding WH2 domain-containing protein [Leptolyngbyaceae cyanobacterium RM2_2_21]NJN04367.1 actin-binding WH2 domain-containing protein [Leptolyngbyaceae cyanobacterium RM1_1_2]NJO12016.1 actin-binding WH2 domain-containing protein [Leptolyngbyaceae cyanobacterium SL_1_1]